MGCKGMRSRKEIEHRLLTEDNAMVIDILRWVIESPNCPFCSHPQRKDLESINLDELIRIDPEQNSNQDQPNLNNTDQSQPSSINLDELIRIE